MLHIITEGNKDLENRRFPIPPGVRSYLKELRDSYNGDGNAVGWKRLNYLCNADSVSYAEMRRLKHFFDHYCGDETSSEFVLSGGRPLKTWVNTSLDIATGSIRDFKKAKSRMGMSNAFLRHHTKQSPHPDANSIKEGTNQKPDKVIYIAESQIKEYFY